MNRRFPLVIGVILAGLLSGIIGMMIYSTAMHIYSDHKGWHQLVDQINSNAAKAQQQPSK